MLVARRKLPGKGHSQPSWFSPMLATLVAEPFSNDGWIFEPKLDGIRCLAFRSGGKLELFSRNRKSLNEAYPELIAPLRKQRPRSFVLDGVMAKRADSPYVSQRSRDWLKFKCIAEQELAIIGYTDPQGTRVGFGALLLGYYERGHLVYAGKAGTGFDRQTLLDLRKKMERLETARRPRGIEDVRPVHSSKIHWIKPRLVAEVAFAEWTRDGKLRQPRFLGLRNDKAAREIVREKPQ
jgi:ATP-dependent DNA ligase